MTAPVAAWLEPADVKRWLRLGDAADDDLIQMCCVATEPVVERARPDQMAGDPPDYTPDGSVYMAAVMLASKLYRRRNSPAGVESFGESVIYTSTKDSEVARALYQGQFAFPAVG